MIRINYKRFGDIDETLEKFNEILKHARYRDRKIKKTPRALIKAAKKQIRQDIMLFNPYIKDTFKQERVVADVIFLVI